MKRYRRNEELHTASIGYVPVIGLGGILGIGYVVGHDEQDVKRRAHEIAWRFSREGKRLGLLEWEKR